MKQILIALCLLAILAPINVEALGLRSDNLRVNIKYTPGFEETYYYSVVSHDDKPVDVEIYVIDDDSDGTTYSMAKYITPNVYVLKDVSTFHEPFFTVTVKLPEELPEPGIHKVHVVTREIAQDKGGFSVRTAIEALYYIEVPYEGQYLKHTLAAESVNQGKPIPITVTTTNVGKEAIQELYADFKLFDLNNKVVDTTTMDPIRVNGQESKQTHLEIPTTDLKPGPYNLTASIHYDGHDAFDAVSLKVGELAFQITNQTQQITTGKINELFVETESEWADPVNNVYAEVSVGNRPAVKTVSENFAGFERKQLKTFFDATGLLPGTYPMVMTVFFDGKSVTKTEKIKVVREGFLRIPGGDLSLTNVLFLIAFMIIIMINIILFVVLVKKKDEHENNK